MANPRKLDVVPCTVYSITLLFFHSKCNGFHLLTPKSQFVPLPPSTPLGNHKSVLHVCESVSVLQ